MANYCIHFPLNGFTVSDVVIEKIKAICKRSISRGYTLKKEGVVYTLECIYYNYLGKQRIYEVILKNPESIRRHIQTYTFQYIPVHCCNL